MIEVICKVRVYETDGKEEQSREQKLVVLSHWNRDELVRIQIGEHIYTVNGKDMLTAISNAQRSAQFLLG